MDNWKLAARLFRILWIGFLLTNLELISLRSQGCPQLNYLKNGKVDVENKQLPSRNIGYTSTGNPEKEKCTLLKTIHQTSVLTAQNTQN
jgi:hypothetical protein